MGNLTVLPGWRGCMSEVDGTTSAIVTSLAMSNEKMRCGVWTLNGKTTSDGAAHPGGLRHHRGKGKEKRVSSIVIITIYEKRTNHSFGVIKLYGPIS
jgi:hypothetical protein